MSEEQEEHKESLESLPKPRQILTDPAKSCQLQPATDLSVASAGQEPALTQSQQLVPRALLTGPTIRAAAQQAGVSERSIHHWPPSARVTELSNSCRPHRESNALKTLTS